MTAAILCLLLLISLAGGFTTPRQPRYSLELQQSVNGRRAFISGALTITAGVFLVGDGDKANAAVTDETDAFANTDFDSAYRGLKTSALPRNKQQPAAATDELIITVPKDQLSKGLGLELGQVEFRTAIRVFVKYVTPGSLADKLGIKKDFVVVSINGQSAERTNVEGVAMMVTKAAKSNTNNSEDSIELRFRDPTVFQEALSNLSSSGGGEVTTQVAPSGDTTQRNAGDGSVKLGRQVTSQQDQKLTVSQLVAPKMCNKGATTDDLLEISYIGTVVETGDVFDGSAIKINGKGIPGRGNDVSLFFVLGKQPFGQFPPGWDVGLEGICVGERRRVIVPPVLAYGSVGVPRRGIPPDATLQYDITLVSINGLAMPQ